MRARRRRERGGGERAEDEPERVADRDRVGRRRGRRGRRGAGAVALLEADLCVPGGGREEERLSTAAAASPVSGELWRARGGRHRQPRQTQEARRGRLSSSPEASGRRPTPMRGRSSERHHRCSSPPAREHAPLLAVVGREGEVAAAARSADALSAVEQLVAVGQRGRRRRRRRGRGRRQGEQRREGSLLRRHAEAAREVARAGEGALGKVPGRFSGRGAGPRRAISGRLWGDLG